MGNKNAISKILAVAGTALVWIPILAPAVFAVIRLVQSRMFLFDYLMPAELFPAVLLGGCLLLWAAGRAHLYRRLIGWSLGLAVLLVFGSQVLAVVTGLASGATEPAGWPWVLVLSSIAGYTLAVIVLGVSGLVLFRTLSKGERK